MFYGCEMSEMHQEISVLYNIAILKQWNIACSNLKVHEKTLMFLILLIGNSSNFMSDQYLIGLKSI